MHYFYAVSKMDVALVRIGGTETLWVGKARFMERLGVNHGDVNIHLDIFSSYCICLSVLSGIWYLSTYRKLLRSTISFLE